MSQKIKKAIKLSLVTQIVNEKRGKIKFTCDLAPILLRRLKMDPSWPYASSSALYMPLRAMTPDTRNYFRQQEVTLSQPAFDPDQFSHGSSCNGSSSPAALGEETFESQSPS